VIDVVRELQDYEVAVDVYEPWADPEEALTEYGVTPISTLEKGAYDAIVVAVAHAQFREMGVEAIRALGKPDAVLYDVKAAFPQGSADLRL
jgi:UDP-N-acetyl-D-galactosamine dehydrogenase